MPTFPTLAHISSSATIASQIWAVDSLSSEPATSTVYPHHGTPKPEQSQHPHATFENTKHNLTRRMEEDDQGRRTRPHSPRHHNPSPTSLLIHKMLIIIREKHTTVYPCAIPGRGTGSGIFAADMRFVGRQFHPDASVAALSCSKKLQLNSIQGSPARQAQSLETPNQKRKKINQKNRYVPNPKTTPPSPLSPAAGIAHFRVSAAAAVYISSILPSSAVFSSILMV